MLVNGNEIAKDIEQSLKKQISGRRLVLAIMQVGSDPASAKFVERKCQFGKRVGVEVVVRTFDENVSETTLAREVRALVIAENVHGIVVQLPLPKHIDAQKILSLIPPQKDPDALSSNPSVLPPVAGAVAEILKWRDFAVRNIHAVVIGRGRLVGKPVAEWLDESGARVKVLGRDTHDVATHTLTADLIVSGAGVPGLISPDMIHNGVALIDAGTSEQAGALVGDIDPACAEKAVLYTPVPGGVGPVTVAKLFENLVTLASRDVFGNPIFGSTN